MISLKQIFDYILAISLGIILLPLFALLCTISYIFISKDIFFTQLRPGKNGKVFKIIKFKTMTDETDSNGGLLPDSERLIGVGKIYRTLSLDEMPQLINILKGELSFVGPRPLLCEYLPLYNQTQKRRHDVLPGITGWAQINGRNNLSWEEKFDLDIWYVDNKSFLLDLKILALTAVKVFKREGIVPDGQASTTKFVGSHNEIKKI